ncbi:hypothetical protein [Nocardioides humi]|uniref:hypothetical protein n=1 Tax=Nocardioides humi TaxID=449461 RepID=UPI001FEC95A0|nr:hypothetical protein [Nocardioides humi]
MRVRRVEVLPLAPARLEPIAADWTRLAAVAEVPSRPDSGWDSAIAVASATRAPGTAGVPQTSQ